MTARALLVLLPAVVGCARGPADPTGSWALRSEFVSSDGARICGALVSELDLDPDGRMTWHIGNEVADGVGDFDRDCYDPWSWDWVQNWEGSWWVDELGDGALLVFDVDQFQWLQPADTDPRFGHLSSNTFSDSMFYGMTDDEVPLLFLDGVGLHLPR